MSIYESLVSDPVNDFGTERLGKFPRIPCLNADQPATIVGLTTPEKRPSVENLNLAPPFGHFFIECSLPKSLRPVLKNSVSGAGISTYQTAVEIGLKVRTDDDPTRYIETSGDEIHPHWNLLCQPFSKSDLLEMPGVSPLVISNFYLYIGLGKDGFPLSLPGSEGLFDELFLKSGALPWIGQDGKAYLVLAGHRYWQEIVKEMEQTERAREAVREGINRQFEIYLPLLYAINSIHNKRTEIVPNQPSRQVRRHAARTGNQPPDHRTITIKDYIRIYGDARKAQDAGNPYPLGEVIGHWRNYGVNGRKGLLFGKYAGTFFVPSFLKGNPNKGATDHDYVIGERK
jgi:hypothetical protein